jgi:hypothetical protein
MPLLISNIFLFQSTNFQHETLQNMFHNKGTKLSFQLQNYEQVIFSTFVFLGIIVG